MIAKLTLSKTMYTQIVIKNFRKDTEPIRT